MPMGTVASPRQLDLDKLRGAADQACALLKVMSNPHRLMILCQLLHGERSVGELVTLIGLSQSALSQHLAKLRHYRLVATRRQAQTIYYRIASPEAEAVIATLYELYCNHRADPCTGPLAGVEA